MSLFVCTIGCGKLQETPFTIAVDEYLLVRQGGAVELPVTITREAGFDDAIELRAEGLPEGVSVNTLLADAESKPTLDVSAAATAAQGETPITILATATGNGASISANLRLLVGGEPGTLDPSFADGGLFAFQLQDGRTIGRDLVIQPDEKIVVTGATSTQAITVRLLSDGSFDPEFGNNGVVSTGQGAAAGALALTQLSDGRIIAAGFEGQPNMGDFALFGYDTNGILDEDFGSAGTTTTDVGAEFSEVHTIDVTPSGNLIVAGVRFSGPNTTHMRRYSDRGVPDVSFVPFASGFFVRDTIVRNDGTVLVAGSSTSGDYWVARLLEQDGSLDDLFAGDGMVTTDLGSGDSIHGLVPVAGEKLLAVGISNSRVAFARYNSNGSLDLTLGGAGTVITTTGFSSRASRFLTVDNDGRVVVTGSVPGNPGFALARFDTDGIVDSNFGNNGVVNLHFGFDTTNTTGAYAAAIDRGGRIVVCGELGGEGDDRRMIVTRLWP